MVVQLCKAMTSTWSDGSRGPICFSCPEGSIDATTIRKFNDEHVGTAMILTSGSKTHYMTSDVMLQVMEQLYSAALSMQRTRFLSCKTAGNVREGPNRVDNHTKAPVHCYVSVTILKDGFSYTVLEQQTCVWCVYVYITVYIYIL